MTKLYKSSTDKKVMGVCGGLAEYFNVDATVIRIIFFFLIFAWSAGFWIYLLLGIVLPYDYQVQNRTNSTTSSFERPKYSSRERKDVTPREDNWDDF